MKTAQLCCAIVLSLSAAAVLAESRREWDFDSQWLFLRADAAGAEQAEYDDSGWRRLDVPHDWSIEDLPPDTSPSAQSTDARSGPFDHLASPGKESTGWTVGGIGWYRKHFHIPGLNAGRRVELRFDGVYMDSDVWLNGKHVTSHPYGYTPFTCELTPFLKRDGENVLAVRVRNEGRNSRWYSGSGIYRQVWLTTTGPVYVPTWGLVVTTPEATEAGATANVTVELANAGSAPADVTVIVQVLNPAGRQAGRTKVTSVVPTDRGASITAACRIKSAQLWDPDHPALYRAVATVTVAGKTVDRVETTFGIRRIDIDAERGLRLNGNPLKLKGGCMHHDNGILGSATIARAEERRVALMKSAGYNAIRTSHNPPSSAFLDACDRLGMLVIDEAFDQWQKPKNPLDYSRFFDAWAEKDIATMVRRDRNHPSVVMWSIGNEVQERFDRPDLALRLRQAVLEHDRTRPITAAICGLWDNKGKDWDKDSDPAFTHLDIGGMNYLRDKYESDHARNPQRVMVCTESYPKEAFEYWEQVEKHPYVIGDFVWTGFDYLGESGIGRSWIKGEEPGGFLGPWPWHIAGCGDLDILGRRKCCSYYREALWRPGVLYVAVHPPLAPGQEEQVSAWGWNDVRSHWTWPGQEGKTLKVDVYSSCDKVTLTLNGKTLGEKPTTRAERYLASFEVPYEAGELKAIGAVNGKTVEYVLKTAGAPASLRLVADRNKIAAGPEDLSFVDIQVVDARGTVVPHSEVPVRLTVSGAGELAAVGNANPVDATSFRQPVRKAFNGTLQAILRPTGKRGAITLRAEADGLTAGTVAIKVR